MFSLQRVRRAMCTICEPRRSSANGRSPSIRPRPPHAGFPALRSHLGHSCSVRCATGLLLGRRSGLPARLRVSRFIMTPECPLPLHLAPASIGDSFRHPGLALLCHAWRVWRRFSDKEPSLVSAYVTKGGLSSVDAGLSYSPVTPLLPLLRRHGRPTQPPTMM